MRESISRKPFMVMLLGGVGAAVGACILLYDSGFPPESKRFVESPQFMVWAFLICVQTAFFAVVAAPVWISLRRLKDYFIGNRPEIVLSSLLFMLLFVVPFMIPRFLELGWRSPLAHHGLKIMVLAGFGFVIAFSVVVGIWLVHTALRTLLADSGSDEKQVASYLGLREQLLRFLTILGTMVGLVTLATGGLRNALLAMGTSAKDFPSELVLVYGLYFTALLAVTYAPTYVTLTSVGRRLRDKLCEFPSPESGSWADWHSNRKSVEEMLKLQVGAKENYQSVAAILAPLAGSVLSILGSAGAG